MDTSGDYIKMCEQATEVQEAWLSSHGDYYLWRYKTGRYGHWHINPVMWGLPGRRRRLSRQNIWLPRQDQLQKMIYTPQPVGYGYDLCISIVMNEWATCYSEHYKSTVYTKYALTFKSLEQLWLAFVMQEKHGKAWDGTEWVEVSHA